MIYRVGPLMPSSPSVLLGEIVARYCENQTLYTYGGRFCSQNEDYAFVAARGICRCDHALNRAFCARCGRPCNAFSCCHNSECCRPLGVWCRAVHLGEVAGGYVQTPRRFQGNPQPRLRELSTHISA